MSVPFRDPKPYDEDAHPVFAGTETDDLLDHIRHLVRKHGRVGELDNEDLIDLVATVDTLDGLLSKGRHWPAAWLYGVPPEIDEPRRPVEDLPPL